MSAASTPTSVKNKKPEIDSLPSEIASQVLSLCDPLDLYPAICAIRSFRKAYRLLPFMSIRDLLEKLYVYDLSIFIEPKCSENPFHYDHILRSSKVEAHGHSGKNLVVLSVWKMLSSKPPPESWKDLIEVVVPTLFDNSTGNNYWFMYGSMIMYQLFIEREYPQTDQDRVLPLEVALYHKNYKTAAAFLIDIVVDFNNQDHIKKCLRKYPSEVLSMVHLVPNEKYQERDVSAVLLSALEKGEIRPLLEKDQVLCWLLLDWLNSSKVLDTALNGGLDVASTNYLPLRMAIQADSVQVLKQLLHVCPNDVDDHAQFLVDCALSSPNVFRMLISHHSFEPHLSLDELLQKTLCSTSTQSEIVKSIIEHDQWDPVAKGGRVISDACSHGTVETVGMLLDHPKLSAIDFPEDIHGAVHNKVDVLKLLVAHPRVTFNFASDLGHHSWYFLARCNSVDVLRYLLYDLGSKSPQDFLLLVIEISKLETFKLFLHAPALDSTLDLNRFFLHAVEHLRVNKVEYFLEEGRCNPACDNNEAFGMVFVQAYGVEYSDKDYQRARQHRPDKTVTHRRVAKIGRMLLLDPRVAESLRKKYPERTDFFGLRGSVFDDPSLDDDQDLEEFDGYATESEEEGDDYDDDYDDDTDDDLYGLEDYELGYYDDDSIHFYLDELGGDYDYDASELDYYY